MFATRQAKAALDELVGAEVEFSGNNGILPAIGEGDQAARFIRP